MWTGYVLSVLCTILWKESCSNHRGNNSFFIGMFPEIPNPRIWTEPQVIRVHKKKLGVPPMPARRHMEENSPAAMLATNRSAGVIPEVNLSECVTCMPASSANNAAHSGFETNRCHQWSKTVAPLKVLQIFFWKNNSVLCKCLAVLLWVKLSSRPFHVPCKTQGVRISIPWSIPVFSSSNRCRQKMSR